MFETFSLMDFIHIALMLGACISCYLAGKINGAANIISELVDDNIVTLERLERWANNKDNE
jgi:hypothetical protein